MDAMHKKPQPLFDSAIRPACPVCGHVSYSPAGIHPQCAMRAADKIQALRVKAMAPPKPKTSAAQPGRFEKRCPKCQRIHHVRKQSCDCGHSFVLKNDRLRVT